MFQGQLLQSESTAARRRVYLHLVDATDGMTPETGEAAGQPQISTNGGSWANTSATLTAIGNGRYYVELTTGELGTLGNIQLRYKSANTAEAIASAQVGLFDPFSGSSAPSAATIAAAVWAYVLEGSYTATHFMRLMASVLFGKASGLGTTTVYFRDMADSKNRIQANVDAVGNRSTQTHDVS